MPKPDYRATLKLHRDNLPLIADLIRRGVQHVNGDDRVDPMDTLEYWNAADDLDRAIDRAATPNNVVSLDQHRAARLEQQ